MNIAILGAGTVGADLFRTLAARQEFEIVLVSDQDPAAPGLALAASYGIATSTDGVDSILAVDEPPEAVFVATNAASRRSLGSRLTEANMRVVDLTPAHVGAVVVPSVNLGDADGAPEISLGTPAAQAAVPFVAAIGETAPVLYAEVVSTVASAALGPGARRSVDDVVDATAAALRRPGGAKAAKAIALVTPAEPSPAMRVSVFCLVAIESDRAAIGDAVAGAAASLTARIPGCSLTAGPLFEETGDGRLRASVLVEATAGAGSSLPPHAGHLELLSRTAADVGQRLALGPVAAQ